MLCIISQRIFAFKNIIAQPCDDLVREQNWWLISKYKKRLRHFCVRGYVLHFSSFETVVVVGLRSNIRANLVVASHIIFGVSIYARACVCVCLREQASERAHARVCMCVRVTHARMNVAGVRACVRACVGACLRVFICMCVYVCTHV